MQIIVNKPFYIGLPIPELSEILIYEIWYEIWYLKPKYGEKAKWCYMDAESFIVYKKTQMISIKIIQTMLKLDLILQIMN